MQCFCIHQKEEDVPNDQEYYQYDGNDNVIFEEAICQQYFKDKLWSAILGQSIAFIIIGVNVVLKMIIIQLVMWIGEDTQSEQKSSIVNGVFYA